MYKNNFVVALKYNGKILRECKDEIVLPFGSEYSILLKNLNTKKAIVDVFIDGESALRDGRKILISPSEEVELEGFKEDSEVKHKFKFIEKIDEIKKHRGDRIEDGLVRVEIQYERELINFDYQYYKYTSINPWSDWIYKQNLNYDKCYGNTTSAYMCCNSLPRNLSKDEGITVEGSDTKQKFHTGYIGTLESNKTIICLKLRGKTDDETVVEIPVLVKTKVKCKYCGKSNSAKDNFCSTCGAKVII